MSNETKSIINFVYFSYNFPHDFIAKCWAGDMHMIKHITDKFTEAYQYCGSSGVMLKFMTLLDSKNQEKLADWINKNYLSFQELKQD